MIGLTHTEAETVVRMKAAIAAVNDLVIHTRRAGTGLAKITIDKILEADYLLNAAEDDFINDDPAMRLESR